jgi:hypothetical protein
MARQNILHNARTMTIRDTFMMMYTSTTPTLYT